MNPPGEPGCRSRTRNRTVASEGPPVVGGFLYSDCFNLDLL
jgi:hypothetical protein